MSNSGTYTFDSLRFVCVSLGKGNSPAVTALSVRSSGMYSNVVCGTGKATSTGNTLLSQSNLFGTPNADVGALVSGLSYQVSFTGMQGLLSWVEMPDYGHSGLGGFVEITPDAGKGGPASPPACSKAFQVEGVLTIDTEPVDNALHCVVPAVPVPAPAPPSLNPLGDQLEPVPAGAEVCVPDAALAADIAGAGGTVIARLWAYRGYLDDSRSWFIAAEGDFDCSQNIIFVAPSLPAVMDNNIESAKALNGCENVDFWDHKNGVNANGGSTPDKNCFTQCHTLDDMRNRASSLAIYKVNW